MMYIFLLDIIDGENDGGDDEILTPIQRKKGKTPLKRRSPSVDDKAQVDGDDDGEEEEQQQQMADYYEENKTGDDDIINE